MGPSTGLALLLFPPHPQPSALNFFDFGPVPTRSVTPWLFRLGRCLFLPSSSHRITFVTSGISLSTPSAGVAADARQRCPDPACIVPGSCTAARMMAMMEFMMKFSFDSAALALSGQGPGTRTGAQVQVQVQCAGLGSQHQMACLTNKSLSTSLLWCLISPSNFGLRALDECLEVALVKTTSNVMGSPPSVLILTYGSFSSLPKILYLQAVKKSRFHTFGILDRETSRVPKGLPKLPVIAVSPVQSSFGAVRRAAPRLSPPLSYPLSSNCRCEKEVSLFPRPRQSNLPAPTLPKLPPLCLYLLFSPLQGWDWDHSAPCLLCQSTARQPVSHVPRPKGLQPVSPLDSTVRHHSRSIRPPHWWNSPSPAVRACVRAPACMHSTAPLRLLSRPSGTLYHGAAEIASVGHLQPFPSPAYPAYHAHRDPKNMKKRRLTDH